MSGDVEALIAEIETMDLDRLRENWRRRYGAPPPLRSKPILRQLLAWRVQAEAFGGLAADTRKVLARTGAVHAEGLELGIGARFSRNWKGREIVVTAEQDGFRWNNQLFPSLSAAATAIAGSRWNGPRFFGLRDS